MMPAAPSSIAASAGDVAPIPITPNSAPVLLAAAIGLVLAVTGCGTDGGIVARTREKSAVYATLKLSEKRFIDKGVIAIGFTPDMVYMAMGRPSKVESKAYPEGVRELWIYEHYYPNYEAGQGVKTAPFTTESHFQRPKSATADGNPFGVGRQIPNGFGADGNNPQIHFGSPPQGGSFEPADLQSFTFLILFKAGKVARFGADPTIN